MKRFLLLGAVSAASALAVSAAPRWALAQTSSPQGFAVNHFDPSERGSEWFALDSLDLRGNFRPAIGVVGEQAYRPLILNDGNGNLIKSIVRDQSFLHIGGNVVFGDRLRVAVDVPIMTYADGHTAVAGDVIYRAPVHSAGLGDVRVGADLRLFGTYGGVITGAIGAQLELPTGAQDSYAGDGSVRVLPHALVAGDIGVFTYAAKAGVTIRTLAESYDNGQIGTELDLGGAVGLRLLDRKLVVGPEVFARSVFTNGAFFSKKASPVEGLIGAHYTLASAWRAGAGVSTGLTAGYGTPVFRGILSLEWTPGMKSEEPPPPPPVVVAPPADRDQDGILDIDDACPDVRGVKTEDPKTNGCPADRDHDGIPDAVDACPDVAGVRSEDPAKNGCPVDPDRDKDGIPNETDACPDEPGKPNDDPKKNGCPTAFVRDGKILILEQVKFRTASAEISKGPDSETVLEAVAGVLSKHTEITAVEVEGHTDNRGNPASNKKLSAARAAAVVRWLTSHGIEPSRLTSAGYGQERPIDTNDTDEGRRNNRRVEFRIK
jgi:outer membrane protein OmpA-like peptidoglycan-associated protein